MFVRGFFIAIDYQRGYHAVGSIVTRHCEHSEAIQTFFAALDCFAALAMTVCVKFDTTSKSLFRLSEMMAFVQPRAEKYFPKYLLHNRANHFHKSSHPDPTGDYILDTTGRDM
jgi:hypothetical protein